MDRSDPIAFFDPMAEDPSAFSKGDELVEEGEMQWLPTPVVAETYCGVATVRSDTTEYQRCDPRRRRPALEERTTTHIGATTYP